jgi:hypothetical protein
MMLLLVIGLVVCVIGFIAYRKPDPYHVDRRDVVPLRERKHLRLQWEEDSQLREKRSQWEDDWDKRQN